VYLSHYILANEADYFRTHGVVRESTALTFHMCSLLLPLLYGVYAAWSEIGRASCRERACVSVRRASPADRGAGRGSHAWRDVTPGLADHELFFFFKQKTAYEVFT